MRRLVGGALIRFAKKGSNNAGIERFDCTAIGVAATVRQKEKASKQPQGGHTPRCATLNRSPSLLAFKMTAANSSPRTSAAAVYRFNDEQRSLSIREPSLPSPWINYLSNGTLHAFVSQAGGGSLWWRTPINFRITRYRGWTSPTDTPGFYVYVREADGTVWTPTSKPCDTALDDWEAVHSPGSTLFRARRGTIEASQRMFIAEGSDALVWDLEVTNRGRTPVALDLFGYAELGLLEYPLESSWGYYVRHQFKTWFDAATQSQLYLFHHESHPRLADVPLVYFAASRPVASYSGDRQGFLGFGRSERQPQGVANAHCGNGTLWGGDPCAALQVPLTVAPGASERLAFYLGVIPGALGDFSGAKEKLARELARLRDPAFVPAARERLAHWWDAHFAGFDCSLPDPDCERQIRTWTPVNCVHTGRFSRSFSQYASGLRGFGFRDTAQDMLAIVGRRPDWARDEFLRLLAHQFSDGHAVHTYFPEDRQPPARTVHSDDHLWLPLLAYALVAESGDTGLLASRVPYLAPDGISRGPEATAWEHLMAALDFTEAHLGSHGIPLILQSDWNDCIGGFARKGRGESTMVAQQYVHCLRLMEELASALGDEATQKKLRERSARQTEAINACCWDGEWWIRGFDDDGKPLGSTASPHGQIWLNAQTWAVLAECGDARRQTSAMDAVERILDTPHGIKKLHPSFPTFPENPDAFSGYSLGCGENGAIFCHANAWAVIAEALLGRADRAWKYFRQLVPHLALANAGLERYQCEPYAYASSIIGPENPRFGLATLTHVTGTAAWMDVAATQYLLGLRPTLRGLKLAPCLPSDWPGFSAQRLYRGCRLEITVTRRRGARDAAGLRVDECRREGDTLLPGWIAGKSSARVELEIP